jgi:two-component system NtrC family sensor kinase
VRALLDFSRESPLQCRLFEVGPWLTETLSLVEQEAKQQDIHVVADQKNEYLLEGDPNLLQQTLINLLRNGLQASDPGSEIHVTTSMKDQSLTIEVQDEGSGIAPEIQDRIFDPFFTSKTAREGSGLGLSISLGIVAQHGGEISVRNQPGGGVSARIVLPRARVVQRKAIVR